MNKYPVRVIYINFYHYFNIGALSLFNSVMGPNMFEKFDMPKQFPILYYPYV